MQIHAPGSRALRRIYAGVYGFLGGAASAGAVGAVAGTVVPIAGNIAGGIAGIIGGGIAGAIVGATGGGTLGARLHRNMRGGQGQQAHIEQAKQSLAAQGVTFSQEEVNNLDQLSAKDWRKLLHVPRNAVKSSALNAARGMSKKEQRQAIREALILAVAKGGKAEGNKLRTELLVDTPNKQERAHKAIATIHNLAGNYELRRAYRTGGDAAVHMKLAEHDQNREQWDRLATKLRSRFGDDQGEMLTALLNQHGQSYRVGIRPTTSTERQLVGALKHREAVVKLVRTVTHHWGAQAGQAALKVAQKQQDKLANGTMSASKSLADLGRLSDRETRAIVDAAWKAALQDVDEMPEPPREALLDKETTISQIERALLTENGKFTPNSRSEVPLDVFTNDDLGGSFYDKCQILSELDPDAMARGLATGDRLIDNAQKARIDLAQSLADYALRLRAQNLPEDYAAEIVRTEMALRVASNVGAQGDDDAMLINRQDNIDDPRQLAQYNIDVKTGLHVLLGQDPLLNGISKTKTDGIANRLLANATASTGTAQTLANLTDPAAQSLMANDAEGLKDVIRTGLDVTKVLDTIRALQGPPDYKEAISCLRLGIDPNQIVGQNLSHLAAWTENGFNRAEALAYADGLTRPSPAGLGAPVAASPHDPTIQAFAGSYLKPSEAQQYIDFGIGYNELTAPTFYMDEHLTDIGKTERGGLNTVHRLTYDTPQGAEQRFFKSATPDLVRTRTDPGKVVGANLGMNIIDKALGFDVIVDTKVSFHNGELGISMANAGPYDARELNNHRLRGTGGGLSDEFLGNSYLTVPRDDPAYSGLYQRIDRNNGALSEQDWHDLRQLYGLDDIRVNRDGQIEIAQNFIRAASSDPVMQEDAVSLQLVDFLGNHKDRNITNWVIDIEVAGGDRRIPDDIAAEIRVKANSVKGIDNDDAFNAMPLVNRSVRLPRVISLAQKQKIDDLFENVDGQRDRLVADLRRVVKSSPDRDEVAGFLDRLKELHAYVNSNRVTVIGNDEWGSPLATALLSDPSRSLIGRDMIE
ncbi:MAG: hypothetical protein AAF830_11740 [Pseudomonadota bacterium]